MKILVDLKYECGTVATLNVTANKKQELINADFHMAMDRGNHEAQLDAKLSLGWNDKIDMPEVVVHDCSFYNCTAIGTECVDITDDMNQYVDVLKAVGMIAKEGIDSVIGTDTFAAKMKKISGFFKKDEPEPQPEQTATEKDLHELADLKRRLEQDEENSKKKENEFKSEEEKHH
jgi:hypothetical protein